MTAGKGGRVNLPPFRTCRNALSASCRIGIPDLMRLPKQWGETDAGT